MNNTFILIFILVCMFPLFERGLSQIMKALMLSLTFILAGLIYLARYTTKTLRHGRELLRRNGGHRR